MDFATLIGSIAAIMCVVMAIQPQNLGQFVDPEGIIVIFGGGICVLMISYPFGSLMGLPKILAKVMKPPALHPKMARRLGSAHPWAMAKSVALSTSS